MTTYTDIHRLMDWTETEFGVRPLDVLTEPLDMRLACLFKADLEAWEEISGAIDRTLTETQSEGLYYHVGATRASTEDMLAEAVATVKRRLARVRKDRP